MLGNIKLPPGTHNHRSHRKDNYALPIMDRMREAGYFTANVLDIAPGVRGRGKTDFKFQNGRQSIRRHSLESTQERSSRFLRRSIFRHLTRVRHSWRRGSRSSELLRCRAVAGLIRDSKLILETKVLRSRRRLPVGRTS